jgi:hypothetical protein
MGARSATMRMRMRMRMSRKPMMDQRRIWRTYLGTSNVDEYGCEDGNNGEMDAEDEAFEAHDGVTQNVED